jgi:glycosyltransferase domain-containing protein
MKNKDLTILLLLKDRVPFTWRALDYYNRTNLPFKKLLADGGKDKSTERLSDKSLFPNLDYEYLRYPYDENIEMFFNKIKDSVDKIHTECMIIADNDDFYFQSSIEKSIDFLKSNRDYSSARGDIYDFTVDSSKKRLQGSICRK